MQYANLGRSGLQVSRICLGGNSWGAKGRRQWGGLDADDSEAVLKHALDKGINFFDTAPTYNDGASEEVLGTRLVGSVPRDELVLLTKVGFPKAGPNRGGLGRKHIMASIEGSLRRLKTDHVDLLVVHRFDPATPIEETMSTLHEIVVAGKVRYLGASVMAARQFIRLQLFAKANSLSSFIEMQNFYNLLYREDERELIPFCHEEGIGLTPYSPLARGLLSGNRSADGSGESERARADAAKSNEFYRDHQPAILAALHDVSGALGVKPAKAALAWLLHQPTVTAPIIGATRPEYIDDAVDALGVKLDPTQLARLEAPYQPRSIVT